MKDLFSTDSASYQSYRPDYPDELYAFLQSIIQERKYAWDCGTGNGQVALKLAEIFEQVEATDISANQLKNALNKPNIRYTEQSAESSSFPEQSFDLITVAQAIHWFDFNAFYAEVKRTLKPGGLLAVIGYGRIETYDGSTSSPQVADFGHTQDDKTNLNNIIQFLYSGILGAYWDPERKFIDEEYKTIPFPFDELEVPSLFIRKEWSLDHLIGYFGTWSALKHYREKTGKDPLPEMKERLKTVWGNHETRPFRFPVLLRIGRLG